MSEHEACSLLGHCRPGSCPSTATSQGYDFLSSERVGRVLDHSAFNGFCRQAYDQNTDTVYRMPYNLDDYNFQVRGGRGMEWQVSTTDDMQVEQYSSTQEIVQKVVSSCPPQTADIGRTRHRAQHVHQGLGTRWLRTV